MPSKLRSCAKTACRWPAAASLSYRYDTRQVWLLDLSAAPDPSLYDLCPHHAEALVVPKGWERVDDRVERPAVVEAPASERFAAAATSRREAAAQPSRVLVAAGNRYASLTADLPRLAAEASADAPAAPPVSQRHAPASVRPFVGPALSAPVVEAVPPATVVRHERHERHERPVEAAAPADTPRFPPTQIADRAAAADAAGPAAPGHGGEEAPPRQAETPPTPTRPAPAVDQPSAPVWDHDRALTEPPPVGALPLHGEDIPVRWSPAQAAPPVEQPEVAGQLAMPIDDEPGGVVIQLAGPRRRGRRGTSTLD